jgi:hypothetical protein
MTEVKIQALVDRMLLRPKAEVEWKTPTSEAFPTEDDKEQVVFSSFFERGFNIPASDFFRGLLFYYKLELVHLVPKPVTVVSLFIDFLAQTVGEIPTTPKNHFINKRNKAGVLTKVFN